MVITWNSLHLSCEDAGQLSAQIQQHLTDQGYTLYDPFKATPGGRAYPVSVRLFVGPPTAGWTRIIGTRTPSGRLEDLLLPALSTHGTTLALTLDDQEAHITAYADGEPVDTLQALTPYLNPDCTPDDLQKALRGDVTADENSRVGDLPMDVLPSDVQSMASRLKSRQINRLFKRMMKTLGGMGDERQSAAREMLEQSRADWKGSGGQRIRTVMTCLTMPTNWHTPDFVTLRDAYQLHLRRQQRPNAPLYPGDAEAMQAVPDALDYTPIYGGQADTS